MAALGHIYVTAHGKWTSTAFLGETAQIGLRLAITEGANEPAKGTIFTPEANGDVVQDSGTQAGTNGVLTRTWAARLGPTGSTDNADATMQADLGDDMWTFLNSVKGAQHSDFRWTHVKIAPILVGGVYGAPSATYTFNSELPGSGTGSCMPPEVAIAYSLRAPIIGRRGRGRFYLPAPSTSAFLATDGTVTLSTRQTHVSYVSTLIANLQDIPGIETYGPTVAIGSASSLTFVRPTEVRIGSHFDAQRRRQDQAVESYYAAQL